MAVWQCDLVLLPDKSLEAHHQAVPCRLTRDLYEETDWWDQIDLPEDADEKIATLLKPAQSWTSEIKIWGDDEGDNIHVVYDDAKISEITVRFDLRDISLDLLTGAASLAQHFECCCMSESFHVFKPDTENIVEAIRTSPASEFIRSPKRFFKEWSTYLRKH